MAILQLLINIKKNFVEHHLGFPIGTLKGHSRKFPIKSTVLKTVVSEKKNPLLSSICRVPEHSSKVFYIWFSDSREIKKINFVVFFLKTLSKFTILL